MAFEQMIRNILVPTDYSDASLNALESADRLLRSVIKASLQILHVGETDGEYLGPAKLPASDHAREVAEAMAVGILQKHGIDAGTIFQKGSAGPVIVQTAFEKKARPDRYGSAWRFRYARTVYRINRLLCCSNMPTAPYSLYPRAANGPTLKISSSLCAPALDPSGDMNLSKP